MLAYQSLNSTAPAYISDILQPVSSLRQILNCLYRVQVFDLVNELLVQQFLAYRIWNALPTDIKRAATLLTFKKKLKTFLFSKHLC